jgi:hypothetical protein
VRLYHYFVAISVAIVALSALRYATPSSADTNNNKVLAQPQPANPFAYLGAGSCSASACHGNQTSHRIVGSEFTLWAARDPHAKAYESLFHEKSLTMQKALDSKIPPHEDGRCLKCHVSPRYNSPQPMHFKTDGVSCETCHGPAKQWIDVHHLDAWKRTSIEDKRRYGMHDMRSIDHRVKTCIPCHVGPSDIDINHELIAAGHPRLFFEFSAFHDQMPHHWSNEKDRNPTKSGQARSDFEARAWLVGQLLTAHASLELLGDRAGDLKKGWPEYAENDCASCHHDLQANRLKNLQKAGALSFGYAAAFSPNAFDAFQAQQERKRIGHLNKTLQRLHANLFQSTEVARAGIAKDAKTAAGLLLPLLDQAEHRHADPLPLNALFQSLLDAAPTNSDETAQRVMGLAALRRSMTDRHEPLQPGWREALEFVAQKMDGPRGHDPLAIRLRWLDFQRLNARKGP